MKNYAIQLGNTEDRAGHRKSCAQLRAEVSVSATSKEAALKLVQKTWKVRGKACDRMFNVNAQGDWSVKIFFRVDTLTLKDVKEV
jgi:hypothetical protein